MTSNKTQDQIPSIPLKLGMGTYVCNPITDEVVTGRSLKLID